MAYRFRLLVQQRLDVVLVSCKYYFIPASCKLKNIQGQSVQARFGKLLLELGGNNAIVVMDDADLDLYAFSP